MKENIKKWLKPILFTVGGALVGLTYYYFVGCSTGACPLTSNPFITMAHVLILPISQLFLLISFPLFPPSLSTDNVSSVRPLLCNPLPSIGITRFLQYYGIVRLPAIHLKSSVFSCDLILFFEKQQVLPS